MSIVVILRNPNMHCMTCGTRLTGEALKLEPDSTHWVAWCPEGACQYAMRRMRVPLDRVACELADG